MQSVGLPAWRSVKVGLKLWVIAALQLKGTLFLHLLCWDQTSHAHDYSEENKIYAALQYIPITLIYLFPSHFPSVNHNTVACAYKILFVCLVLCCFQFHIPQVIL